MLLCHQVRGLLQMTPKDGQRFCSKGLELRILPLLGQDGAGSRILLMIHHLIAQKLAVKLPRFELGKELHHVLVGVVQVSGKGYVFLFRDLQQFLISLGVVLYQALCQLLQFRIGRSLCG
jgi:hypothetical protein